MLHQYSEFRMGELKERKDPGSAGSRAVMMSHYAARHTGIPTQLIADSGLAESTVRIAACASHSRREVRR